MRIWEKVVDTLQVDQKAYLNRYFKDAPEWILDSFQLVKIPPNTVFIEEGEQVEGIFILIKGKVSAMEERVLEMVYKHYEFYPIEVFGAMELIGELDEYMTTLVATEECVLLKTSRAKYERWLSEDHNAFRMQAARIERYLLTQARKERLNVLLGGVERVIMMLCHSYEVLAENSIKSVCVSRKEVFEKTGLSERTVTRVLKDLESKSYISRRGWDIIISFDQYQVLKELLENTVYHAQ